MKCPLCQTDFEKHLIKEHVEDVHTGKTEAFSCGAERCRFSSGFSAVVDHCFTLHHNVELMTRDVSKENQLLGTIRDIQLQLYANIAGGYQVGILPNGGGNRNVSIGGLNANAGVGGGGATSALSEEEGDRQSVTAAADDIDDSSRPPSPSSPIINTKNPLLPPSSNPAAGGPMFMPNINHHQQPPNPFINTNIHPHHPQHNNQPQQQYYQHPNQQLPPPPPPNPFDPNLHHSQYPPPPPHHLYLPPQQQPQHPPPFPPYHHPPPHPHPHHQLPPQHHYLRQQHQHYPTPSRPSINNHPYPNHPNPPPPNDGVGLSGWGDRMNDEGGASTGINGGNLHHRPQSRPQSAADGGNGGGNHGGGESGGVGSMDYRNLLKQHFQVDQAASPTLGRSTLNLSNNNNTDATKQPPEYSRLSSPQVAIGSATKSVKSEPDDAAAVIVEISPPDLETRDESPAEHRSVPLQPANPSQTLLTDEECNNPAGNEGGENGAKENERKDLPMTPAAAKIEKCVKCDLELKGVLNPYESKAHQAAASHSEVHLEMNNVFECGLCPHTGPSGAAIRSHHKRQHGGEGIRIFIPNEDTMQRLDAIVSECFPLVNMKSYYRNNYSVRKLSARRSKSSAGQSASTASTEKSISEDDQEEEVSAEKSISQAAANKLVKLGGSGRGDGGKPTVGKRLSSIGIIAGSGDGGGQQRSDAKRRKVDNLKSAGTGNDSKTLTRENTCFTCASCNAKVRCPRKSSNAPLLGPLFKHAETHAKTAAFACVHCDFKSVTSRSLSDHCGKRHPNLPRIVQILTKKDTEPLIDDVAKCFTMIPREAVVVRYEGYLPQSQTKPSETAAGQILRTTAEHIEVEDLEDDADPLGNVDEDQQKPPESDNRMNTIQQQAKNNNCKTVLENVNALISQINNDASGNKSGSSVNNEGGAVASRKSSLKSVASDQDLGSLKSDTPSLDDSQLENDEKSVDLSASHSASNVLKAQCVHCTEEIIMSRSRPGSVNGSPVFDSRKILRHSEKHLNLALYVCGVCHRDDFTHDDQLRHHSGRLHSGQRPVFLIKSEEAKRAAVSKALDCFPDLLDRKANFEKFYTKFDVVSV